MGRYPLKFLYYNIGQKIKGGGKCFKMQIAIYGFKDFFSYCKPC